jgi:hypothetical protein
MKFDTPSLFCHKYSSGYGQIMQNAVAGVLAIDNSSGTLTLQASDLEGTTKRQDQSEERTEAILLKCTKVTQLGWQIACAMRNQDGQIVPMRSNSLKANFQVYQCLKH